VAVRSAEAAGDRRPPFLFAAGITAIVLGAVVMLGWAFGSPRLVQLLPALVPMQFNTAICFALSGAGLVVLGGGLPRAALALVGLSALVALLTLAEYALSVSLGIDELFMEHAITVKTLHPGRMSWMTAVAFLFTAGGVAAASLLRRPSPNALQALLGSVVTALGLGTLTGYAIGFDTPFGWEQTTPVAVHTAAGFAALGLGLFLDAWARSGPSPTWLPIPIGVAGFTVAVVVWQSTAAQEQRQIAAAVEEAGRSARRELESVFEARHRALLRMGRRWEIAGGTARFLWEADAAAFTSDFAGHEVVEWVDSTMTIRWLYPTQGHDALAGYRLARDRRRRDALAAARAERRVVLSRAVPEAAPGAAFSLNVPLFVAGRFDGYVVGVSRLDAALDPAMERALGDRYALALLDGDDRLYGWNLPVADTVSFRAEGEVAVGHAAWTVLVWPTPALARALGTAVPQLTLVLGLVITALLVRTVQLARAAGRRAVRLEDANVLLEERVAERTKSLAERADELSRANAGLRRAERRFRRLVDVAPYALIITGADGKIVGVNDLAESTFGYGAHELDGQPVETLMPPRFRGAHVANRESYVANPEVRPMGVGRDLYGRRKDGSEFPVQVLLSHLETDEGPLICSAVLDITERKAAEDEIRRLNVTLEARVAERTQALESFSYSVSHDLKAPLRAIDGFSRILEEDYAGQLDDEGRRLLGVVRGNTQRMALLIDQLLAFSRLGQQRLAPVPVDMNELVGEVIDEVRAGALDRTVRFEVAALPPTFGDRGMLRQVLANLIGNAVKFSRTRDAAVVRVDGRDDGRETVYRVHDNGVGFDPAYVDKMFGVFQRLHRADEFEGTGVGLAIVRRVVDRHDGRVWAEGKPGEGASLSFSLPKPRGEDSDGA